MKTGNRKVLKVITLVLSVFILFNIFWYAWRDMKYGSYINDMEENELSSWIVPRYKHVDDEKLYTTFRYTNEAIENFEKWMEE